MEKITNLTSRKFLVAIGALVTLLTGVELDDRRALVIVLIAVAYIVAEAAVDWRSASVRAAPAPPDPPLDEAIARLRSMTDEQRAGLGIGPRPTTPDTTSANSAASGASTETKTTNTTEA